jgi:hypothetical protein
MRQTATARAKQSANDGRAVRVERVQGARDRAMRRDARARSTRARSTLDARARRGIRREFESKLNQSHRD